ncbi:MAG TPA: hypothetical protein VNZ26_02775 [Vicinamibacterales bacterium]|jgi:hypothetical protein|nr:hypothetical protein [Vicinamibacterales bacterium]
MKGQWLGSTLVLVGVAGWLAVPAIAGQSPYDAPAAQSSKSSKPAKPAPRNADGHADLNGIWSFATATPVERATEFGTKLFLTDEEAAQYASRVVDGRDKDKRSADPEADVASAYNDFWWDQGNKLIENRTSLVVDPPDGRIPVLTAEAQRANAERARYLKVHPTDGPENRNLSERCLVGFSSGPPFGPSAYNNNVHLFQTRDYAVILTEMIHTVRMVPLDGRPHVNSAIREWSGDSRGHWEGDTLVVETTNFRPDITGARSIKPETFRLVERFTRVSEDTVMYEYTMNDPTTWTRPWSVQLPMTKSGSPIYEYACHEGNRAMENMLKGARAEERGSKTAQ